MVWLIKKRKKEKRKTIISELTEVFFLFFFFFKENHSNFIQILSVFPLMSFFCSKNQYKITTFSFECIFFYKVIFVIPIFYNNC